MADLHLLEKKKKENAEKHAEWMRKAELAVDKKGRRTGPRGAGACVSFQQMTESFAQQIADQEVQVESLKAALKKLELKLAEARGKADMLIAQHRRSRAANRAADAQLSPDGENRTFDRMQHKVAREEALGEARANCWATTSRAASMHWSARRRSTRCWQSSKQRKRLTA